GKVLILDHVLRPGSGWGLPGGFMEPFEQPEKSIRRELKEEVGLELAKVRLVIVRNFRRHIEVIYRADAVGEARVMSREIIQFGWFDPSQLPADLNEGQKTLVGRILADKFD
nr:NUDIX domain-containing protein [Blastocatellia bacterium]